ncbi:ATP-binding protein, partial [Bordetella petrii]
GARARAFARFDRVGSEGATASAGSGLGLSIARAYARRNDGDIELRDGEPNPQGGVGLAAVLWVPLVDAQALSQATGQARSA